MNLLLLVGFGLFGGAIRALVGLFKNKVFQGKEKFKHGKFWFTIIGSAIIGAFCALLIIEDYRFALIAGYAGTDFIQGIYRMRK